METKKGLPLSHPYYFLFEGPTYGLFFDQRTFFLFQRTREKNKASRNKNRVSRSNSDVHFFISMYIFPLPTYPGAIAGLVAGRPINPASGQGLPAAVAGPLHQQQGNLPIAKGFRREQQGALETHFAYCGNSREPFPNSRATIRTTYMHLYNSRACCYPLPTILVDLFWIGSAMIGLC